MGQESVVFPLFEYCVEAESEEEMEEYFSWDQHID